MIETNFDVSFVAQLAQREKQIQQSYRLIIGVHKWFARRPGALFRDNTDGRRINCKPNRRTGHSPNDSTQAQLACVKDKMQQIYPLDLVDKVATQVLSELTEVDLPVNFGTKEETAAYAFDDQISLCGHAQVTHSNRWQDFYFSCARSPDR